jgi:DNA polymerase/3'-5' exonuclease PolX
MDRIKPLSESHPPRITFGDIKYKEKDGVWYSYTIPQYLTAGSKPNFPAGGRKHGINSSIKETAAREFYEESGIDLSKEPFDLSKLIDLGLQESGYRIYSYIPTEEEFKEAQSNIHAKNLNGFAEVHALEFVSTKTKIATHARRQFGKFTKKTKGTKQRWRRTVRTLQKY